jgi:hypothetical protein
MKLLIRDWPPLFSRGVAGIAASLILAIIAVYSGERLSVPRKAVPRLLFAAFTNVFAWMGFYNPHHEMAERGRGRSPRLHDADLGNSVRMAFSGNAANGTRRCSTRVGAGRGLRSGGRSWHFDGWQKADRHRLRHGRSGVFRFGDNLESVAASRCARRVDYVASRVGMRADGNPRIGVRAAELRRSHPNRVGRFDLHSSGWYDHLLPDLVRHASLFASGDGINRDAARSSHRRRISGSYI